MKHLNTYITEYIIKKKLDKPIDSEDHYKYFPETKQELINNVKELLFDKDETNLNCIDTSKITDMSRLFETYENINFDISEWNVSNVKDMCFMFMKSNFNGDISNWDVSKVKDMGPMFYKCEKFEGKGLENWDVSNIINMRDICLINLL